MARSGTPIESGFRKATPEETQRMAFSPWEVAELRRELEDIDRCQAYAKAHSHEYVVWR